MLYLYLLVVLALCFIVLLFWWVIRNGLFEDHTIRPLRSLTDNRSTPRSTVSGFEKYEEKAHRVRPDTSPDFDQASRHRDAHSDIDFSDGYDFGGSDGGDD